MDENEQINALLDSVNIAESLSEEELYKIGVDVREGFDSDLESRVEWERAIEKWTKLAKQTVEPKTWPWPGAANIKYPLLSTAAMQFAARAYPSLVPSNGIVVGAKAAGKDPTGERSEIAKAISIYMSYQVMEEMKGWEEEMDKLLIMLPIVGTMFKKTYWDSLTKRSCSKMVLPKDLVVNYWARCLDDAERISEVLEVSERKVKERQQAGLWLPIELGTPPMPQDNSPKQVSIPQDATVPYIIIEQHTFLDLDEDGYKEPYIVTFHKDTKKVLRIVARFDMDGVQLNDDGEIVRISPTQYYTKFGFVPNPDGGFYDIGFGVLLGPINESVNTVINQLLDSGHLSTLGGGFIGKGLRLRMGETRFMPAEWKAVNATGDDLRKQIVPLPTKEPSDVLFQLMGALITSGKELASVAEIFTGKMPGQNTPATTTMATVEQGMKVFTAVYKRLFRSLGEEFLKLARLNSIYLDPNTEVEALNIPLSAEMFKVDTYKIYPNADPNAVSQSEKLAKAQALMELLPSGILDPVKVVQRILEAQEQPNWQDLLNPQVAQTGQMPPPPPDPKIQEMQMKAELEKEKIGLQAQAQQHKMELESRDKEVQLAMKQEEHALDMQNQADLAKIKMATALAEQQMNSMTTATQAHQKIIQNDQSHRQKMQQQKEAAKNKNTSKGEGKK